MKFKRRNDDMVLMIFFFFFFIFSSALRCHTRALLCYALLSLRTEKRTLLLCPPPWVSVRRLPAKRDSIKPIEKEERRGELITHTKLAMM
jgi:hypothetical protein